MLVRQLCHSGDMATTRDQDMATTRDEMVLLHANVCKGLGDPKRLMLIDALRDGERSVTELTEALEIPQANVSQHLAILRDKGLVRTRKEAQKVYYTLTSQKIVQAMDLMRDVMHESLPSS